MLSSEKGDEDGAARQGKKARKDGGSRSLRLSSAPWLTVVTVSFVGLQAAAVVLAVSVAAAAVADAAASAVGPLCCSCDCCCPPLTFLVVCLCDQAVASAVAADVAVVAAAAPTRPKRPQHRLCGPPAVVAAERSASRLADRQNELLVSRILRCCCCFSTSRAKSTPASVFAGCGCLPAVNRSCLLCYLSMLLWSGCVVVAGSCVLLCYCRCELSKNEGAI